MLLPAAILVIPYADLLMAVVRRTRAGMSPFAADKKHLHHRLLNIGHSHRQSVLIMYLWAALFTGSVVSLSLVRTNLIVLVGLTLVALLALLLVTMPRLRPGLLRNGGRRLRSTGSHAEVPTVAVAGTGPRSARPPQPASAAPGPAAVQPARPATGPAAPQPARPVTGPGPASARPGHPFPPPGPPFPPRARTPAAPQS